MVHCAAERVRIRRLLRLTLHLMRAPEAETSVDPACCPIELSQLTDSDASSKISLKPKTVFALAESHDQ